MTTKLQARNDFVDWQVAPAEYELQNYDEPKIQYRQYVEQLVKQISKKTLKKRPFFTISTNVLCADISSSKASIDPIERDLYLPLEIAITKWSLQDGLTKFEDRKLQTKFWMIDPGSPTSGSICYALAHQQKYHKIKFDHNDYEQNPFIEKDLTKIMKEINGFLTVDRTVFSIQLKHCRQDLGALKWLNQVTGCKSRPIKVYSLEDLYVVLVRHLNPLESAVCQGIAECRLKHNCNSYDPAYQCDYHKAIGQEEEGECEYCAKAISSGYSNVIIDDVLTFTDVFSNQINEPKVEQNSAKINSEPMTGG